MKIKELRKRSNMTQEEFAEKIGLKRTTYATYEQEAIFPQEVLKEIEKQFGIAFSVLVDANHTEAQQLLTQPLEIQAYINDIIMKAHAEVNEAKDKFILNLEQQVKEKRTNENLLQEIKKAVYAVQQTNSDVLAKSLAVQEVVLDSLADLKNTSLQELRAAVRIKENALQKNAPRK